MRTYAYCYPVKLSEEQRRFLETMVHTGRTPAKQYLVACVLLMSDQSQGQSEATGRMMVRQPHGATGVSAEERGPTALAIAAAPTSVTASSAASRRWAGSRSIYSPNSAEQAEKKGEHSALSRLPRR